MLCVTIELLADVAQLVRASDCGFEGRGFEPLRSPVLDITVEECE